MRPRCDQDNTHRNIHDAPRRNQNLTKEPSASTRPSPVGAGGTLAKQSSTYCARYPSSSLKHKQDMDRRQDGLPGKGATQIATSNTPTSKKEGAQG